MARIIVDGMRVSGPGARLEALGITGKGLWRGTWPKKKPPKKEAPVRRPPDERLTTNINFNLSIRLLRESQATCWIPSANRA